MANANREKLELIEEVGSMYTKIKFGEDLEIKLKETYNIIEISKWAFEKYLSECSDLEDEVKDAIMTLVVMEEGPEFECTKEELIKMVADLKR